ncbi:hypothetical protein GCM10028804_11730 [Larkinella terrae]
MYNAAIILRLSHKGGQTIVFKQEIRPYYSESDLLGMNFLIVNISTIPTWLME